MKTTTVSKETITDDVVLQAVGAQIDAFIKAYRGANPQPSPTPTVKAQGDPPSALDMFL